MGPPVEGRTFRSVWWGAVVGATTIGCAGALVARPVRVTVWVLVVAGILGILGSILYEFRDTDRDVSPRDLVRTCARRGVVVGVTSVSFTGYAAFLGGWSLFVVMLAVPTSPWAVRRWRRWKALAADEQPADSGETAATDSAVRHRQSASDGPATSLESLGLDELCHAWRASYGDLQRAQTRWTREQIVEMRQSYLDELERRNPTGFAAWLDAGARAASDPGRFL